MVAYLKPYTCITLLPPYLTERYQDRAELESCRHFLEEIEMQALRVGSFIVWRCSTDAFVGLS